MLRANPNPYQKLWRTLTKYVKARKERADTDSSSAPLKSLCSPTALPQIIIAPHRPPHGKSNISPRHTLARAKVRAVGEINKSGSQQPCHLQCEPAGTFQATLALPSLPVASAAKTLPRLPRLPTDRWISPFQHRENRLADIQKHNVLLSSQLIRHCGNAMPKRRMPRHHRFKSQHKVANQEPRPFNLPRIVTAKTMPSPFDKIVK